MRRAKTIIQAVDVWREVDVVGVEDSGSERLDGAPVRGDVDTHGSRPTAFLQQLPTHPRSSLL